jgi:DNA polymerase III epsilon subunit-like protein
MLHVKLKNSRQVVKNLTKLHFAFDRMTRRLEEWREMSWAAIDIEAFEFKHERILEVGVTTSIDGQMQTEHYIVQENIKHQNRKYVKGNRDNFDYGESQFLMQSEIVTKIKQLYEDVDYLVFVGVAGDKQYLKRLGAPVPKDFYCVDAGSQLGSIVADFGGHLGVARSMDALGLPALEHPHNAGNDSYATALVWQTTMDQTDVDLIRDEWLRKCKQYLTQKQVKELARKIGEHPLKSLIEEEIKCSQD